MEHYVNHEMDQFVIHEIDSLNAYRMEQYVDFEIDSLNACRIELHDVGNISECVSKCVYDIKFNTFNIH